MVVEAKPKKKNGKQGSRNKEGREGNATQYYLEIDLASKELSIKDSIREIKTMRHVGTEVQKSLI